MKTLNFFKKKFGRIMKKVSALEKQDTFTERDVAIAQELCKQYSDTLQEMEEAELILDVGVTAKVGDKLITFEDGNDFANWIAEAMR